MNTEECKCDFQDQSDQHRMDCPEWKRPVGRPVEPAPTRDERMWLDSLVERWPARDLTGWILA